MKMVKLKELCTVNQGLQIPIADRYKEPGKNRYFYITVQFLKDSSENYYIENPSKSVICSKEDILVVRTGNTGQVITGVSGCFHNNFFKVTPNEKIYPRYLYYALNNKKMHDAMLNAASGTTIPDLKHSSFYDLEIPLPELDIQKKISSVLDDICNKMEFNNKTNDNLQEVGQQLLLNDLDDESCISYRLEEIFYHISPGTNYQPERLSDGIPFLNVKNINNGYIDYSDSKFISSDDYKKVHKTWQPEENDLLISRIGTLGLVAVIRKEDLPLAVHYNFLDLKTNKIPFEFGYFLLKSDYFQNKYKFNIKNSVQEYVTVDDIKKIECKIPNPNCFNKYKVLYNMILNIQRENRTLVKLRDTLLPKLMNGEIDLENIEI